MKTLAILSLLISFSALAKDQAKIDLLAICQGKSQPNTESASTSMKVMKLNQEDMLILDKGFCSEYLKQQSEIKVNSAISVLDKGIQLNAVPECHEDPSTLLNLKKDDKWKVRFYASHSFTTYFKSDVNFSSSRYNIEVKDYQWAERSSREFFTPEEWAKPQSNPFQMIDEPSNTFTVSIEKNGNEFFLSAFHPKFLQNNNQVSYMKGTIDGVAVDGYAQVNRPFDGYNQEPGESEIVRNENTHRQMTFELGYGHRFTLLDSKLGSITYTPSIGAGVMVGNNLSAVIKENAWWDFDYYQDQFGIQGVGGSFTNRLEFNTKKERFGVFYENKLGYYHQEHGFLDGKQTYNLGFMGNSIGMKFMIHNPNNKKKKVP